MDRRVKTTPPASRRTVYRRIDGSPVRTPVSLDAALPLASVDPVAWDRNPERDARNQPRMTLAAV
jgi:hypothetical protein